MSQDQKNAAAAVANLAAAGGRPRYLAGDIGGTNCRLMLIEVTAMGSGDSEGWQESASSLSLCLFFLPRLVFLLETS